MSIKLFFLSHVCYELEIDITDVMMYLIFVVHVVCVNVLFLYDPFGDLQI